jgi:phosphoribosylanthranilate isomerase
MRLKTFVKVSGISNLSDARYCAGMGVDLLGFGAVDGRENYIPATKYQEIRGWVTGPRIVAEIYGLAGPQEIDSILEQYKPDFLELGLKELSMFTHLPVPVILAMNGEEMPPTLSIEPAYIISDSVISARSPILISVESRQKAEEMIENPAVHGIVLKGGAEIKPGLKDYEVLNEVLELLETFD